MSRHHKLGLSWVPKDGVVREADAGDVEVDQLSAVVVAVTPVRWLRRRRPWWGEGEGEAMGENDGVQRLGARRGRSASASAARAASSWRRGELALAGVTSLPALARAGS